jgi:hypothetical protein
VARLSLTTPKANVGISTVQRIENAAGPPNVRVSNLASIQSTLEAAGIKFTNGDAPGLRMADEAYQMMLLRGGARIGRGGGTA